MEETEQKLRTSYSQLDILSSKTVSTRLTNIAKLFVPGSYYCIPNHPKILNKKTLANAYKFANWLGGSAALGQVCYVIWAHSCIRGQLLVG